MLEHKHLIVKGSMTRTLSAIEIDTWLHNLVKILNMDLIDNFPNNPSVAEIDGENGGVTGCALITTSHIVIHTWDSTLEFQLDVYPCKGYRPKDVEEHCKQIGLIVDDKRMFDRKYNIVDEDIS